MEKITPIYSRQTVFSNEELVLTDNIILYRGKYPFSKKVYKIPISQVERKISFDQTYHLALFLIIGMLFFSSIMLLWKFKHTQDWRLYFGYTNLILSVIFIIIYLFRERHQGHIILDILGEKIIMKATRKEFNSVKTVLMDLLESQ